MQHESLKNLYEQVIQDKFGWDRWGLLGVLCDYVLNYTKGDIVEIGCGESSIYLSKLAEKYDRTCFHCEYSRSGVENFKKTKGYFGKNSKVFNEKSDRFLIRKFPPLALAFIDGDHRYEQVLKDFVNIFDHIVENGYIFLHDTLPPSKEWEVPSKCGTVYKLRRDIEETWTNVDVFTFPHSAFDVGLTMVRKRRYRQRGF
jgi:hypothetical protein